MQNNVPQHQGLGAPQGQSNPNPYYTPNQALQVAQAQQINAQAGKANAERAILEQGMVGQPSLAGPQPVAPGPQVSPQEVQAQQIADAIVRGELNQEGLGQAIQQGQVGEDVARAAVGMAQSFMSQNQGQGLGAIQ